MRESRETRTQVARSCVMAWVSTESERLECGLGTAMKRGMTVPEIIKRYLDEVNVERLARDFKFLLKAVAGSYGELELAFRKGRLSVYYRGNSLAVIYFSPADMYRVEIHERFLAGLTTETRAQFTPSGKYRRVTVDARGAHRILQRRNVGRLMKAIRDVNHSEELTFGRSSSPTTLRHATSCSRAARSRTATCTAAWTSSGCGDSRAGATDSWSSRASSARTGS